MKETDKKSVEKVINELATLPDEALDFFRELLQRHSYSARLDAHHSVRSILASACSKTDLLVVSGRDQTDSSGKAVLPIHRLLCGATGEGLRSDTRLVLIREPQFVATPLSSIPVFATALTRSTAAQAIPSSIVVDRDNNPIAEPVLATIEVEVMMWKPDGSAAANAFFSWICTVEAGRRILFG
jgi:hypothetical protein